MLRGIGASEGLGMGNAIVLEEKNTKYEKPISTDPKKEKERFHKAVETFSHNTLEMAEKIRTSIGEKEAEILMGQVLMMEDPYLQSEVEKNVDEGKCAEEALELVCKMFEDIFLASEDPLTMERVSDVRDIYSRMLSIFLGVEDFIIGDLPFGSILVAKDLTPSMTAGINKENVVAIVTELGGKTSHSAILARALGIPAVLRVKDCLVTIKEGEILIVDGKEGIVHQQPSLETISEYFSKKEDWESKQKELQQYLNKETKTKEGQIVELVGNIGTPEDAKAVVTNSGEGVGLFRTEFLFMNEQGIPSEETQFIAYQKVAIALKGKPVIIRTLDIGGDKDLPALGLTKEENPFLGFRAIRFCLERVDLFKCQIRSILRASHYGQIRIMIPLVTCIDEIRTAKSIINECKKELDAVGIPYDKNIQVGVMMETPAASMLADLLAKEADFFSIGTNDLTQYTMAVDRGNGKVAYLYSTYQPAVLRSIQHIIKTGHENGIPVGMCGEAASDPKLIPVWLSFGLDEFSVGANEILFTRCEISKWSKEAADELTQKVMALSTETEIVNLLVENL